MLERWFDNQWSKNEISTINFKAIGLLEVLNSHVIAPLSVFRLKTIRGPRNERRWQEVLWYQELLRGGEILTIFLTKRDGNTSEVRKNNGWIARNSRYNTKHEQACVGGKAIKWSMIIQFIEGKDVISHLEFNWYPGWAQNVDDHDTFVARVHEDVIDR